MRVHINKQEALPPLQWGLQAGLNLQEKSLGFCHHHCWIIQFYSWDKLWFWNKTGSRGADYSEGNYGHEWSRIPRKTGKLEEQILGVTFTTAPLFPSLGDLRCSINETVPLSAVFKEVGIQELQLLFPSSSLCKVLCKSEEELILFDLIFVWQIYIKTKLMGHPSTRLPLLNNLVQAMTLFPVTFRHGHFPSKS